MISLVLRQSFVLIGVGIVAGLVLTFAAQRVLMHSFAAMNSGMSGSLLLAGISMALVAALAAAAPELSDGVILTGYSTNTTWQPLFLSADGHLASENQPARFANYSTGFVTWGDKYYNQYSTE